MALSNEQKAKAVREAGKFLKALTKGMGRKKNNQPTGSGDMAGLPAQPIRKGCGACG